MFDPLVVLNDVLGVYSSLQERRRTPIRLLKNPFAPEYVTGSDYRLALVLGHVLDKTMTRLADTALTAEIQTIDGKGHLAFSLLEDQSTVGGPSTHSGLNPWEDIAHHIRRVEYLSLGISTARNAHAVPFGIRLEI